MNSKLDNYSWKACGDNILDTGPFFNEQCDDGNTVGGDGCSSTCTKETLPRTHSYTVPHYDLVSEQWVHISTDTYNNIMDCKSPYLPAPTANITTANAGSDRATVGKLAQ